jgi:hypothetical protein
MINHKFTLTLLLILVLAFWFTACGKKETTTGGDTKEQKTVEQTTGEQKTENKSNELGITEGLPANYPSDVPQPKNSKVLGSLNTSEGTVVTFESSDRPKDVLAGFAGDLEKNGFEKDESEMMSDDGGLALWKKDSREVSIMLAWDKDKNVSSVVITYK